MARCSTMRAALLVLALVQTCWLLPASAGIPVCAPGLKPCGTSGCYSELLSECVNGRCQSRIMALMQELGAQQQDAGKGGCIVPFMNACAKDFCSNGELCISGKCTATSSSSSSSKAPAPQTPLEQCTVARASSFGCEGDASPLSLTDCTTIGVAPVASVRCYESKLFKCAAGGGATVSSCKGEAVMAEAAGGLLNATVGGLNSSQPLLQPMLQAVADVVGNTTQALLNLSSSATAPGATPGAAKGPAISSAAQAPPRFSSAASSVPALLLMVGAGLLAVAAGL